jgi:hypothetical protein
MNRFHVVKIEPTYEGCEIRIWIDDDRGRHLAVAEGLLTTRALATMVVGVEREQQRADQYQLTFDD